MKILIAGGGDTGIHLAKSLSRENQDVVLMCSDRELLQGIDSSYNLMVAAGTPTLPVDLRMAGAESADLFIAVTPYETDNLIACQLAHDLGAKKCVARIENGEYLSDEAVRLFKSHGVETMVYPELLAADAIYKFIERNWVSEWVELHAGKLIMAAVKIDKRSPLCDIQLKSMHPSEHKIHVSAIRRNHKLIIPGGDDFILEGDMAYFTFRPDDASYLSEITGRNENHIRNIMISGAGKITKALLPMLKGRNVTVLEEDRDICEKLASDFSSITVVNAGPRNLGVLREEEIRSMDLFVALQPGAESNIVSCMVAKENGVRHTVAEIEDIPYIAEAESLWIDKVVNKKLITSSVIYRQILGNGVRVGRLVSLEDAEVAEIEVKEGSSLTKEKVSQLRLPSKVTLGGLIRHGEGMLIDGSTRIMPGDKVMVFFLPGSLLKVERLFRQ